jgi:hypothetical protein
LWWRQQPVTLAQVVTMNTDLLVWLLSDKISCKQCVEVQLLSHKKHVTSPVQKPTG